MHPFPKIGGKIANSVPLSPLFLRLRSFTIWLNRQKEDTLPHLTNQKGWRTMLALSAIHDGVNILATHATHFTYRAPFPANPGTNSPALAACTDPFVTTLQGGLSVITNILVALGVAIAIIGIIVGGLMRATSYGSEQRIMMSNKAITCAVIGLVIVLVATSLGDALPGWFKEGGCPQTVSYVVR
jgi:type IV secretory pathway VirB2 component (pilin)